MSLPLWLQRVVAVCACSLALVAPLTGCNDDAEGGSPAGASAPSSELPDGDDANVAHVVDGDTLRTADDVRVRLLNIDTPEPSRNECWATEATERLTDLVPPGTPIRLVYDRERLDRYGRTLAHIYRRSDGLWVNRQLALDGAARAYVLRPNDSRYSAILAAADAARRDRRGLWGACRASG